MQNGESPDSKDQLHRQESATVAEEGMHQYHPAAVVIHSQHLQQFPAAAGVLPRHYSGMHFVGCPHHHLHHHPLQENNQQGIGPGQTQRVSRNKGFDNGESNRVIWVGDLHHWMDENYLHSYCRGRFKDDGERSQAMTEMNSAYCLSRPMRVSAATPRKTSLYLQQYSPQVAIYQIVPRPEAFSLMENPLIRQ